MNADAHQHRKSVDEIGYSLGSGMVDWFCADCGAFIEATPIDDSPEILDQVAAIRETFGV